MKIAHTQNYRKLMLVCQKGKNGWETREKGQRSAKKTGQTKKRKSFKNRENIKREWEAGNICQKREVSDQNRRVGISGISQRMTLWMLPNTETVGDDLQLTALGSTNDDNDDYQWSPAEFRNWFSFGNVCWHRAGSHWMCGTAGLNFPPRIKLTLRKAFSPCSCSTTPIQAKSFDVKINVAICLEQGVADRQMYVYEWLQQ